MPRLKPDVTININFHNKGEKHKLEISGCLFGRCLLKYNRVNSKKMHNTTATEIADGIRKMITARL